MEGIGYTKYSLPVPSGKENTIVIAKGDYLFTRTIMIQNKTGNVDNNFDYVGFWRSTANIDKFLSFSSIYVCKSFKVVTNSNAGILSTFSVVSG